MFHFHAIARSCDGATIPLAPGAGGLVSDSGVRADMRGPVALARSGSEQMQMLGSLNG